jgi:hypothetical protein
VPQRPNPLRQQLLYLKTDVLQWELLYQINPDVHQRILLCHSQGLQWEMLYLNPDLHQRSLLCLSPGLQWEMLCLRPDVLQSGVLSRRPVLWIWDTEILLPAGRRVRKVRVRQRERVRKQACLVLRNPRRMGRLALVAESRTQIGCGVA